MAMPRRMSAVSRTRTIAAGVVSVEICAGTRSGVGIVQGKEQHTSSLFERSCPPLFESSISPCVFTFGPEISCIIVSTMHILEG